MIMDPSQLDPIESSDGLGPDLALAHPASITPWWVDGSGNVQVWFDGIRGMDQVQIPIQGQV